MRQRMAKILKSLGVLFTACGAMGFVPTILLFIFLNGSAIGGAVIDERYFVCGREGCSEVWPIFYNISWYVHTFTFSAFFAMLCCFLGHASLLRRLSFQKGPPLS